jgi:acetyl-CoA carboxylase carboxyltransferase component
MWIKDIEKLEKRKKLFFRWEAKKNAAKQQTFGRMTVREPIDALFEKDAFLVRGILSCVRLC